MTLRTSDTYAGPTSCDAVQIDTAFKSHGKTIANLGSLIMKWAPIFGLRGEAVAGEIGDETGWGTNWWTLNHNNILSIGVTGEATSTPKGTADWQPMDTPQGKVWLRGYHFATVEAGLLAGLVHLSTYIYGRDVNRWPVMARKYFGDTKTDPRLPALLSTNYPGSVTYFSDLGNGRFAAASGYAEAIVSRANIILGTPHPITKTLGVPGQSQTFYTWMRSQNIPVVFEPVDDGWVGRGGLQPVAIVHHVTDGYGVMNAVNWWRNNNVDASTQQIVAAAGDADFAEGTLVIVKNDEDTAWANGVWGNPNLSIPTVAQWYNQNINPNRVTLSREHVGKPFDSSFPSDKQMLTSFYGDLNWIAKYPGILADRNHFLKHSDIDSVNRANCPGPRFPMDSLIARVVAALQNTNSDEYETLLNFWQDVSSGKISVIDGWQKYWNK